MGGSNERAECKTRIGHRICLALSLHTGFLLSDYQPEHSVKYAAVITNNPQEVVGR